MYRPWARPVQISPTIVCWPYESPDLETREHKTMDPARHQTFLRFFVYASRRYVAPFGEALQDALGVSGYVR